MKSIPERLGWVYLSSGDGWWVPHTHDTIGRTGRLIVSISKIQRLEEFPLHDIPKILAGGKFFDGRYPWWGPLVRGRSWEDEVILPYLKMRISD